MRNTSPNETLSSGRITVQFPNASHVLVKSKVLRVLLEENARGPVARDYKTSIQNQCILLMERILHQLICSSPHYLQGFVHPRWFSRRISEPSTVCHQVTSRFSRWSRWGELNQLFSGAVVRLTCTSMARCMCTLGGVTVSWMRFGHVHPWSLT